MTAAAVVIGIGNEYRRDDGVGPAAIRLLESAPPTSAVRLICLDGEPARLVEAWTGAALAVVLDAAVCVPSRPGRIHRGGLPGADASTSSHGLGVAAAIALGEALGRLPGRLVLLTVEAADTGQGAGLSAPVAAALPALVEQTRAALSAGH